ncbi:hypothetical protein JOD17_001846 [Geomicrobium sediminis]|uniref:Uncharacterized protein n=1 Tax=Geomicrobium sediminis TaxID=1347788 RepID=A0ABS2PBG4_9BACL|nr:hypothetical protein [Geomicrobium sediminis]
MIKAKRINPLNNHLRIGDKEMTTGLLYEGNVTLEEIR